MSSSRDVVVLRVTPSFANNNIHGSGLNSYFHSKYSKFRNVVLTENKGHSYKSLPNTEIYPITVPIFKLDDRYSVSYIFSVILKGYQSILFLIKTILIIAKVKPQIIHLYSPIYLIIGVYCKVVYGAKIIVSLHGSDIVRLSKSKLLQLMLRIVADKVLTLNKKAIKQLSHVDVEFLGNGFDESIFCLDNLSNRRKWLINVAGLRAVKNHMFLLDIFADFNQLCPDFKLIIVGDGRLKLKIQEKIHQMNLDKNVILLGAKEPEYISRLLNLSHAFVLTSKHEGSPKVVFEAMACGLPVVSTRVGDLDSLFYETECQTVHGGKDSFLLALRQILDVSVSCREALSRSVSPYSWETVTLSLDNFYRKCL